jgi:nitrite reductase (NADH) large subunit
MSTISKYVCQCKSVTKAEVKSCITKSGARTLLDVQNLTKASTGCGRCKPYVMKIAEDELNKIKRKGIQLTLDF